MERHLFSIPIRIRYANFCKLQRAIRFIISKKIKDAKGIWQSHTTEDVLTSPLDNGMNYLRTGDGFLLSILLNNFLHVFLHALLIAEHGQFACHVKKPEKSPSMIGFTKTYPPLVREINLCKMPTFIRMALFYRLFPSQAFLLWHCWSRESPRVAKVQKARRFPVGESGVEGWNKSVFGSWLHYDESSNQCFFCDWKNLSNSKIIDIDDYSNGLL